MDTLTIGDASVVRIEEMVDSSFLAANFFVPFDPEALRPHMQWLAPRYYVPDTGAVVFSMHAWVVKTGRHTVLIDACIGNDKERMPRAHWHHLKTPFLDRLRASGTAPEDVDYVMCTHLHADHIGWNTVLKDGRWVPTFPKARYWVSTKDWEACHQPDVQPTRFPNAPTCVWPLADLGLVEFMKGEHALTRTLTAVPTPGHTPGHMSILVTSHGERALVLGDAAHSPVQLQEPDWVSRADMDPDLTRQTRRTLLDRVEREEIVVAAGHFEAPGFGRIVRLEGRRYWRGL